MLVEYKYKLKIGGLCGSYQCDSADFCQWWAAVDQTKIEYIRAYTQDGKVYFWDKRHGWEVLTVDGWQRVKK